MKSGDTWEIRFDGCKLNQWLRRAIQCSWAARSKRGRKLLKRSDFDRCTMQAKQMILVMDRSDGLNKTLRNEPQTQAKIFDNQFLTAFLTAFLAAFLAAFLTAFLT